MRVGRGEAVCFEVPPAVYDAVLAVARRRGEGFEEALRFLLRRGVESVKAEAAKRDK